ncbi:MAG TPA: CRTAC1 family protein [Gemmataceae bacterium]|nr:CRTAC1 family protein [Gemmataceae bacterium]
MGYGALLAAALLCCGCGSRAIPVPNAPTIGPALPSKVTQGIQFPNLRFTDITAKAGIHFEHVNGAFGKKLLPETMGSGVAFLDYDNDGLQDLLFVNGCYWPGYEGGKAAPLMALYRNKGNGEFEDVTAKAGLAVTVYGMGVTVGDYDNDGWPDVFITAVGGNRLFRNVSDGQGGRRFEDVTETAGVGGQDNWPKPSEGEFLKVRRPITFPSSAAFLDYDGDGLLDLFVCNYVSWSPSFDLGQPFQLTGSGRAFGPPTAFEGTQCVLYRNLGKGRFEDVSAKAGVQVFEKEGVGEQARVRSVGKSLGVIVCDVDDDGWPDLIVANDTVRNFFFHNKGDGTFEEIGQVSGVAFAEGKARGAMGIDWAQYRPGRFGVLLANFADEPCTFLCLDERQRRQMLFSDRAMSEGILGPSRLPLKFGTFFFDYDNDGRLDLLICNGHLEPEISSVQAGQTYEQPAQLYWNTGGKATYAPVSAKQAGPDLFVPMVGRGSAYGDINNDGYPDVVLTANGGRARLLRNEGGIGNNWIRLVLEGDGKRSNRSAIGAKIRLEAAGKILYREVTSGRGYLSQSELPVTFGLGEAANVDRITIQWPGKNGDTEVLTNLAVNKVHLIKQGLAGDHVARSAPGTEATGSSPVRHERTLVAPSR